MRSTLPWSLSMTIGVILPLLVGLSGRERDRCEVAWEWVGVVIAVPAVVEFLTSDGFVYGRIYDLLGDAGVQHWGTYRAAGSFNHPIPTGMFLTCAALLWLWRYLTARKSFSLVFCALCAVGSCLTLTRSAILLLLLGAAVLWFASGVSATQAGWARAPASRRATTAFAAVLVGAFVVQFTPLLQRLGSEEAVRSSDARRSGIDVAYQAFVGNPWWGYGPGSSQIASRPFNPTDIPLESMALQVLVSLGLTGTISIVLVLYRAARAGMARRDYQWVAVAATCIGAMLTFNGFEAKPTLLLVLGIALSGAAGSGLQRAPAIASSQGGGRWAHP
jgi:hypothetical protein